MRAMQDIDINISERLETFIVACFRHFDLNNVLLITLNSLASRSSVNVFKTSN